MGYFIISLVLISH